MKKCSIGALTKIFWCCNRLSRSYSWDLILLFNCKYNSALKHGYSTLDNGIQLGLYIASGYIAESYDLPYCELRFECQEELHLEKSYSIKVYHDHAYLFISVVYLRASKLSFSSTYNIILIHFHSYALCSG